MKAAPFEYFSPSRLDEAVALLAEHGDEAKVLAGGQSLVPMMAFRLAAPSVLVDLNRVHELSGAQLVGAALRVRAMTRHRDVEQLPGLCARCPMVTDAVASIGHVAIRNRGTVGGSLAHADPAAEWGALALVLDAEVEAVGPTGARVIPASELFVGYLTTSLSPDEIVSEIRFRLPEDERTGSAFVEVARQHGDFALAGAAAVVRLGADSAVDDVRIGLIGVKDVPVRPQLAESALRGERLTEAAIGRAAEAIDPEIDPLDDGHGTPELRRAVAKTVFRRALARAGTRAQASAPIGAQEGAQAGAAFEERGRDGG